MWKDKKYLKIYSKSWSQHVNILKNKWNLMKIIELAESMKILEAFKVKDFLHCDPIQINNHNIFIILNSWVRNM